jgi:hypothetical protein
MNRSAIHRKLVPVLGVAISVAMPFTGFAYEQGYDVERAYDESVTGCTSWSATGNFGNNTTNYQVVTYFSVPVDMTLESISYYLGVVGTPADTVTAYVFEAYSGTWQLLEAGVATSTALTVSAGVNSFEFENELTAGNYVAVLRRDGSVNVSNYYQIMYAPSCAIRASTPYEFRIFNNTGYFSGTTVSHPTVFTVRGSVPETSEGSTEVNVTVDPLFDDDEKLVILGVLLIVAGIAVIRFFIRVVLREV